MHVWHFPHQWHLNELVTSSPFWVPSQVNLACSEPGQSPLMASRWLCLADKWIWQKNCLGKAIPQASQQFLSSFFTSIQRGEGKNLSALPAQGEIYPPQPRCVKPGFLLLASQDEHERKSVTAFHYHLWPSLSSGKTNKKVEQGGGGVIRVALPPRRLISLLVRVVLSLCWRLRVLCMEMKFLLCHLCPLKKDWWHLLMAVWPFGAPNEKMFVM